VTRPRVAVSAGNVPATEAAVQVARAGGNAVDVCLASAISAWVAEPFFASMAGSGFVVVRTPEGLVEVFDGNSTMPTTPPELPGQGVKRVYLDYSNGMYTGIGGGAVAVPGVLAAVRAAWERHGKIEWPALFEGAIRIAREGLPFPRTSAYYLSVTWGEIWEQYHMARELFSRDEAPLAEGDVMQQHQLAEALQLVADRGPGAMYEGELASEIEDAIAADGGFLARDDLKLYDAEIRTPVSTEVFGWVVESNPPPAAGGAVLTHMLALLQHADLDDRKKRLQAITEAETAAVGYRTDRYQEPGEIAGALEEVLSSLRAMPNASPETTHTSATDADGYACSITESNGYGSGLVVHGVLLNNTLGEEELNPLGAHGLPAGSRCHSNMAPTIATGGGRAVAMGSPGADRIVGAIAQAFISLAVDGLGLAEAVTAPRAHIATRPQGRLLCYEPGLPGDQLTDLPYIPRPYEEIHMFFGGVQAASVTDDGVVDAAHDPRRSGGSACI
jgi:gamma-glutamyltranspeptidase/glutathione hydrolase